MTVHRKVGFYDERHENETGRERENGEGEHGAAAGLAFRRKILARTKLIASLRKVMSEQRYFTPLVVA